MLFWILAPVFMVQAAVVNNTYRLPVNKNDVFSFQGARANVNIVTRTDLKEVRLKLRHHVKGKASADHLPTGEEAWSFSFRRIGNTLVAKVQSELTKSVLRDATLKTPMELYEVEVLMPALPIKVHIHTGQLKALGLKSDIEFSVQKGGALFSQGAGRIKGFMQSGKVEVKAHKGAVEIDAYKANIAVSRLEGEVKLDNFAGSIQLDNIEGSVVKLKSFKGDVKGEKVKARVEFDMIRTPLQLVGFEGELRGKSEQGRVDVKTLGKTNIRIRTVDAPVKIRAVKSGARVNLGSEKGQIYAPSYLRLNNYGGLKVKSGRLRGNELGQIFVRTTNGNIRVN